MIELNFNRIKQQLEILNNESREVNMLMSLVTKWKSAPESSPFQDLDSLRREQTFLESEKHRINKRISYLTEVLDGFTRAKGQAEGKLDDAISALKATKLN